MSHLGRWLSALVDGELDGTERDRVLNHVAGCQSCRQEANAMRALKRRLTALGQTAAEPAIAGRLLELAALDHGAALSALPWSAPARLAHLGRAIELGPRLLTRTWRLAAASAGGSLVAIGVAAFLLGSGGAAPVPRVTPSVDSYLMQHYYDAGLAPAGTGAAAMTPAHQVGAGQVGAGAARRGQPAARHLGHGVAGSAGQRTTGVAALIPAGQTSAAATASPQAEPAPSSQASPSPGQHVTSSRQG